MLDLWSHVVVSHVVVVGADLFRKIDEAALGG